MNRNFEDRSDGEEDALAPEQVHHQHVHISVEMDLGEDNVEDDTPDEDPPGLAGTSSEEEEEGYHEEEEEVYPPDHPAVQHILSANHVAVQNYLNNALHAAAAANNDAEERQCWVCFACEEDDPYAEWVHPCRCRGTTKWVHQSCIQRWVDEKQKGNNTAQVECPQCGTEYTIKFPRATVFVACLDAFDKLVQRLCPIIAGGVCVGSLYWTCVTFGAVTVMQVVGHDRGLVLMERSDPLFLLVSLPLVPVGLVLGKMVRWEEAVIGFLRRVVPKIPLSRFILPSFAVNPERQNSSGSSLPPMSDPVSVTRTFCGALFFPTVATFLGSTLYENVPSQLKRTLLGGLTFIAIKGVLKIYHKQHSYIRQCQRVILDFDEAAVSASTQT